PVGDGQGDQAEEPGHETPVEPERAEGDDRQAEVLVEVLGDVERLARAHGAAPERTAGLEAGPRPELDLGATGGAGGAGGARRRDPSVADRTEERHARPGHGGSAQIAIEVSSER